MKIICKKNDLIESINIALRAVPSKTTMPILECIVIEVEDKISFISNDMEIGIRTDVNGDIVERGVVAVNARLFADIIRKLPEEEVIISTDYDFNTSIKCGKSKFNLKGNSNEEFPPLPVISRERSISISQFSLKEIIRQTIISIADNDLNKIMTGELFEIKNGILRVVSIDGQRFSIRRINLSENYNDISVIVPGKTLIEMSKILTGGIDEIGDVMERCLLISFQGNSAQDPVEQVCVNLQDTARILHDVRHSFGFILRIEHNCRRARTPDANQGDD